MTNERADELRSMLRRELMTLAVEISGLRAAIHERHARVIVIFELLALLARRVTR